MPEWLQVVLGVLGGVLLAWLLLVLVLWREQRKHPGRTSLVDLLRLAPDVVRLLKRLATDRAVPVGVRIWLGVLMVYLLSPIDLIPDFIPVLGYLDDALVVVIALRFATKHAGIDAVTKHWPGTPSGLAAVLRLAGLAPS
ncbi:MAG: DUF1232 domain-containing protein [Terrimesophilobacter sp.]